MKTLTFFSQSVVLSRILKVNSGWLIKTIQTTFILFFTLSLYAQPVGDQVSLKPEAVVSTSPLSIELNWPFAANASQYTVSRKPKNAPSWSALATLPGSATSYTDTSLELNTLYDYQIIMQPASGQTKRGYVNSGIEVIANSNHGIAIIVIEQSHLSNPDFENALAVFLEDIELSGWYPKPIYVNASDQVPDVKNQIVAVYNEAPAHTNLLVLIGKVPVPYSGNTAFDGHNQTNSPSANHEGAWPTDTYYADIDGVWTDVSVNNTTPSYVQNRNIPGDGKFDQSYIPSDVELQTGRIDLSNMPAFSSSETARLTAYLRKNHRYKTGEILVEEKALIDDNFPASGFSQNGYNNFASLVGRNQTFAVDYFTNLSYNTSTTGTYLWSYGCGGGNWNTCSGIGTTADFANDSLSSIFTMLFGSYFGDWNHSGSSFMKAPLAQGNTLTNCWAGRPNYHFMHMGMGENIGYSIKLTQNNSNLFFSSTYSRGIQINLIGDPSLKMTYIEMPSAISITEHGNSIEINWSASVSGAETGYNIYRRYEDSTEFIKLNSSLVTGSSFTDHTVTQGGTINYYVKAVEMKTTRSGSFENESLGKKGQTVWFPGTASLNEPFSDASVELYPNPAGEFVTITNLPDGSAIKVTDVTGKVVAETAELITTNETTISTENFVNGIYIVHIEHNGRTASKKLVVNK